MKNISRANTAIMVKLFFVFFIAWAWITLISCQRPSDLRVSKPLPIQAHSLYTNTNTILELIAKIATDVNTAIDDGATGAVNVASIPQQLLYSWIGKFISSLEKGVYYATTVLVGNDTVVEESKNLLVEAQKCLVDSSVDLPKYVTQSAVTCVTTTIEEPLRLLVDAVREVQMAFRLFVRFFTDIAGCDDFVCLLKQNLNPAKETLSLLFRVGHTFYSGVMFVATITTRVPACFTGKITIRLVSKLLDIVMRFLNCFFVTK